MDPMLFRLRNLERDLIYIKEKKYTTVTLKQVEEYVTPWNTASRKTDFNHL